jgi:hypothetical protein
MYARTSDGPVRSVLGSLLGLPFAGWAQDAGEQKSIRMTCGTCPEGYATTGTTQAPSVCKDGDPTLVQCVPLGANLLPVCGSCPDGYVEIGSSSVPSRCGNKDGGRLSQCQLQRWNKIFPTLRKASRPVLLIAGAPRNQAKGRCRRFHGFSRRRTINKIAV